MKSTSINAKMNRYAITTKLLVLSIFILATHAESIYDHMYMSFDGNPCVKLLNSNSSVGCSTGLNGVTAILKHLPTDAAVDSFLASPPSDNRILVIPSSLLSRKDLITDLHSTGIVVGAVITESKPTYGYSPELPFPQTPNGNMNWNPNGNGDMYKDIAFPLWKLNSNDSFVFENYAKANDLENKYPYNAAEITLYMHPSGNSNSKRCLSRNECQPLGGYSTYTTFTPIDETKDIIFVMAGIDSASMFQKKSIGANSEMSGTVAVLGAIDALTANPNIDFTKFDRQVIVSLLDAESFGYTGSKKLLHDIDNFECLEYGNKEKSYCSKPFAPSLNFQKIKMNKVHSLLELKQVGNPGSKELFIHQTNKEDNLEVSQALLDIGSTLNGLVVEKSSDGIGLPPSSLTTFVDKYSDFSKKGVVIADHNGSYKNKFYHSIFDDFSNVDETLVCKASTLLAKAIYQLSNNNPDGDILSAINSNCTLVSDLLYCMTKNQGCPEVVAILPEMKDVSDAHKVPNHYVSVFSYYSKKIYQKFIHDWVYYRTATENTGECDSKGNCEKGICIKNQCVQSSTFYHDAISTGVEYDEDWASWGAKKDSDADIWTESNWTPIGLRLFKLGNPSSDYYFLAFAIFEVIAAIAVVYLVKKCLLK
eukprot:TRINITY_DN8792_c0_g1_i1.p1 TRINITY_DN8792_c0_g1~~TRINITY_DN8792_c0_g1_i1.p1  ORF type:complete len:648 (+),score=117.69 TRINITY_DN8792_c0_g1_i1:18-1961(+)